MFSVQGSGFRVQGSGFRPNFRVQVQGSGFKVQGSGFRILRKFSWGLYNKTINLWYLEYTI